MKVSVVVPVRDEEDSIRELLDSLLAQTRPPDEVVITDGGSTDATPQIIDEYIRNGAPVRLIRAGPALPGRGRNLGAAQASHEWLGFTDAGIRLENNWLEALVSRAEADDVDVVYGSWQPVTDTFFKQCAAIAYVPPPTPHDGIIARPRFIASTLLRREAWATVNGFPEELRSAEDLIFMDRVENAGYRFVYEPRAIVHWDLRPTLWATFKRFVVYSRNNIRAGLFWQWQATVLFKYYGVLAILLATVLILRPSLAWFPIAAWLLLLVARAAVAIRRNRSCYPASLLQNVVRVVMIIPLLAVLDAAAIVGSIQWLLLDCFRWSRKTPVEAGNGA
jgi:glycosyltransferase involved in cell wall biosynthesis